MVHTLAVIIPALVMTLRPAHHCISTATPEQRRRAARVGPEVVAASAAEEMQVCAAALRSLLSVIYSYVFCCFYTEQGMTGERTENNTARIRRRGQLIRAIFYAVFLSVQDARLGIIIKHA